MFSKSKLEEILEKSPPKSTNSHLTLQEKWGGFLEFMIIQGYDKDHALELAKENAEISGLKMPKDSTFQTWWSTKSSKLKSVSKKSKADASVPTDGKNSASEPISEKIRQRIQEEMEADGWVKMGAGLTIYLKLPDAEGNEYQVWTGRNQPGTEPGEWVIQDFQKWNNPKGD